MEACPNQNSILVARSLVFLRPISASFPAEEVDNREETAARVHTSRRGVLCNRGCQGGEHTPLPPLLWKPRGGAARATRNAIPKG